MKFLIIALSSFLCVAFSVQDDWVGPEFDLKPWDLTYEYNKVEVKPYKNLTKQDIEYSAIVNKKIKQNWTLPDPFSKNNKTYKISCGAMQGELLLTKVLIQGLKKTAALAVLRTNYENHFPQDKRRLDMNVTIPSVTVNSMYHAKSLHAKGRFTTKLHNVTAAVAVELHSVLCSGRSTYRIFGLKANVKVPSVKFQLETIPKNPKVENNVDLIQMGVDTALQSVKDQLGDQLVKILDKHINEILP